MGANSSRQDTDSNQTWSGPSTQTDANTYTQQVQNFWTDERLAAAIPRPMPTDENNDNTAKSVGLGGEIKK